MQGGNDRLGHRCSAKPFTAGFLDIRRAASARKHFSYSGFKPIRKGGKTSTGNLRLRSRSANKKDNKG